jgi:hypothetical protein
MVRYSDSINRIYVPCIDYTGIVEKIQLSDVTGYFRQRTPPTPHPNPQKPGAGNGCRQTGGRKISN